MPDQPSAKNRSNGGGDCGKAREKSRGQAIGTWSGMDFSFYAFEGTKKCTTIAYTSLAHGLMSRFASRSLRPQNA